MATNNSRVQFSFVPTGKSVPASPDQNTIYFVQSEKQIYVGSTLIAVNNSDEISQAIEAVTAAAITVEITGSGNNVVDAAYNSSTHKLTLTKGSVPEYVTVKKVTPNSGAAASYQLQKDGTAVGVDIDVPSLDEYEIKSQTTPETGASATYQLFKGNTAVGVKINIPKDMVVSAGTVKTVATSGSPYSGAVAGDKYIELTIANASSDKLYIPVKDLVDVYTSGTGITVSAANVISHDAQGANTATTLGTDDTSTSTPAVHVSGQVQYDSLGHVISVTDKDIGPAIKTIATTAANSAIATWTVVS